MIRTVNVEIIIPAFCAVSVFDISQKDGDSIPKQEAKELLSAVEGNEDFIKVINHVASSTIGFEDIPGDLKGYFSTTVVEVFFYFC